MGMNKRGDIFSLWLVMITLFMCSIAITSYVFQQGNLDTAVVSSAPLLRFEDRLDIYEVFEQSELREQFCSGGILSEASFVSAMGRHSSLFFEDKLYYDGKEVPMGAVENEVQKSNFLNTMYSFGYDGGDLIVRRSGAVREFEVANQEEDTINFVMGVSVSLDKEYVLDSAFC